MQKKKMLIWYVKPLLDSTPGRVSLIGYVESEKELQQFLTSFQVRTGAPSKREVPPPMESIDRRYKIGFCENGRFSPLCSFEVTELRRADSLAALKIHEAHEKRQREAEDFRNSQRAMGELPQGREWPPWR